LPIGAGIAHGTLGVVGLGLLLFALRGPARGVDTGVASFGTASAALFAGAALTGVVMCCGCDGKPLLWRSMQGSPSPDTCCYWPGTRWDKALDQPTATEYRSFTPAGSDKESHVAPPSSVPYNSPSYLAPMKT
jgi:hypothetical protein